MRVQVVLAVLHSSYATSRIIIVPIDRADGGSCVSVISSVNLVKHYQ